MIETNIIDEIINCGISSEDSILQIGAGYRDGELLKRMSEYWEINSITGIDIDSEKIKSLSESFHGSEFSTISMQEYLDEIDEGISFDWCVLTGVFNEHLYGNNQYDYVFKSIARCLELSSNGVIFTLKQDIGSSFTYSSVFIFTYLISNYSKVSVKKFEDDSYIFSILK